MTTKQYDIPTKEQVEAYLHERRNWGRWGDDDQRGAMNLITPEKRVAAAKLVRSGRSVSLSRDIPTRPGPGNPNPATHFTRTGSGPGGVGAIVCYGIQYHGSVSTHIDALCDVWDVHCMWCGLAPSLELTGTGARFAAIFHLCECIC